jgi:c-di-AMP phosphodiesterase-like protein
MEKVQGGIGNYLRIVGAIAGVVIIIWGVIYNNIFWAALGCIMELLSYYFSQRHSRLMEAWLNHYMDTVVRNIERANSYAVHRIPVGIGVFDKQGKLQWKNKLFAECTGANNEVGSPMEAVLPPPDNKFATLHLRDTDKQIKIGDRSYNMLIRRILTSEESEEETGIVVYLMDVTDRERQKKRYEEERVCVGYVQFDNYSDVMKGLNESTRANLAVEVTKAIGGWVDEMHGIYLRYADDLYSVGISRKALAETIERKFEVLDKVRAIKVGNKLEPTISIGFSGEEKNLSGLGQKAQSCLDLALGRGGDQAVVAQNGEMLFFGAKGTVQAKNTRVRARIVAQAIHELLSAANKVFVMGHMNEDYDSIGASIGVAKMALDLKKETYIVTSGQGPSLARLETVSKDQAKFYMNLVVNEDEALKYVSDDSLLILVDHHREMITAAPKVLKAIRKKVIIDHHRRAEDAIKDVILQYMEPSSSSSSELVTEILQYFDDKLQLTPVEATALYAGIIVDTKNFAVQTGQRTFEAAAFLRGSGADPKMVFHLFRDTEQTIVKRAKIIAEMKIPIPGVAISVFRNAPDSPEVSLIVAQAADELLTMDDIKVSVVMSENAQGVGISARSDGTVNVQVMMEELGGGGHQTVAGVQAKGITADELIPKIITMAKEQMKENDKDESNSIAGREEVGKKGGDN